MIGRLSLRGMGRLGGLFTINRNPDYFNPTPPVPVAPSIILQENSNGLDNFILTEDNNTLITE